MNDCLQLRERIMKTFFKKYLIVNVLVWHQLQDGLSYYYTLYEIVIDKDP